MTHQLNANKPRKSILTDVFIISCEIWLPYTIQCIFRRRLFCCVLKLMIRKIGLASFRHIKWLILQTNSEAKIRAFFQGDDLRSVIVFLYIKRGLELSH